MGVQASPQGFHAVGIQHLLAVLVHIYNKADPHQAAVAHACRPKVQITSHLLAARFQLVHLYGVLQNRPDLPHIRGIFLYLGRVQKPVPQPSPRHNNGISRVSVYHAPAVFARYALRARQARIQNFLYGLVGQVVFLHLGDLHIRQFPQGFKAHLFFARFPSLRVFLGVYLLAVPEPVQFALLRQAACAVICFQVAHHFAAAHPAFVPARRGSAAVFAADVQVKPMLCRAQRVGHLGNGRLLRVAHLGFGAHVHAGAFRHHPHIAFGNKGIQVIRLFCPARKLRRAVNALDVAVVKVAYALVAPSAEIQHSPVRQNVPGALKPLCGAVGVRCLFPVVILPAHAAFPHLGVVLGLLGLLFLPCLVLLLLAGLFDHFLCQVALFQQRVLLGLKPFFRRLVFQVFLALFPLHRVPGALVLHQAGQKPPMFGLVLLPPRFFPRPAVLQGAFRFAVLRPRFFQFFLCHRAADLLTVLDIRVPKLYTANKTKTGSVQRHAVAADLEPLFGLIFIPKNFRKRYALNLDVPVLVCYTANNTGTAGR